MKLLFYLFKNMLVRRGTRASTVPSATRGASVIGINPDMSGATSRVSCLHCSNVLLGARAITVASATRGASVIGINPEMPRATISGFVPTL